jgi:hypothetical protein
VRYFWRWRRLPVAALRATRCPPHWSFPSRSVIRRRRARPT